MKNGAAAHTNGLHINGFHSAAKAEAIVKSAIQSLPWYRISYKSLFALLLVTPAVPLYFLNLPLWSYPLLFVFTLLPIFLAYVFVYNWLDTRRVVGPSRLNEFIEFRDEGLKERYSGAKMPMETLYEAYADQKLDFKRDILEALEHRESFATFALTWNHVKIFCLNFLPEMLNHSRVQDLDQVCDHYDRGNDFYEAFLGPMMIYTSGILTDRSETLEDIQRNKLAKLCEKVDMKAGDRHLDVGCGWGTLVNYAAEHKGTESTGVSISKNQIQWARDVTNKRGLCETAKFLCMDYRDIPKTGRYEKITCLEMAEHVGVLKFQGFLCQMRDLMTDDGVFFLQIAGLRRAWQWEDFVWGLFMDKYIFPGADASCPLSFVIQQLEAAGFEIANTETIGIHYSYTIHRWYQNWVRESTKEEICAKYGTRLYRIWEIFLAWSTIVARQGNSTCFQIVSHKNLNGYDRSKYFNIKDN